MNKCKDCKHFTSGVTERQAHKWSGTNWGAHADGVCHLFFPRGYIGRTAASGTFDRTLLPVGRKDADDI